MNRKHLACVFFFLILFSGSCFADWYNGNYLNSYSINNLVVGGAGLDANALIRLENINYSSLNVLCLNLNDFIIVDTNANVQLERIVEGTNQNTDGNAIFRINSALAAGTYTGRFKIYTNMASCAEPSNFIYEDFNSISEWTTVSTTGGTISQVQLSKTTPLKKSQSALKMVTDGSNDSAVMEINSPVYPAGQKTGIWFFTTTVSQLSSVDVRIRGARFGNVITVNKFTFIGDGTDWDIINPMAANTWYYIIFQQLDSGNFTVTAYSEAGAVVGSISNKAPNGVAQGDASKIELLVTDKGAATTYYDELWWDVPSFPTENILSYALGSGETFIFSGDSEKPVVTLSADLNNTFGFTTTLYNSIITINCTDNNSYDLNYIVSINDVNVLNTVYDANSSRTVAFDTRDYNGTITIRGVCVDKKQNSGSDLNVYQWYSTNFVLINEETGAGFALADINSLILYALDSNTYYNLKTNGKTSIIYIQETDEALRFELGYDSTCATEKYFRDFSLGAVFDSTTRVCIPAYCPTMKEHFLASNSERFVAVKNQFANCYDTISYTDYAYQTYLIKKVYLINARYNLYILTNGAIDYLANIDGSVEAIINLDSLELGRTEYTIDAQPDAFGYSKVFSAGTDSNMFQFFYYNIRADNSSINFKLYDGTTLVFEYTETENPNDTTFYYNYTGVSFSKTQLKMVITKTKTSGLTETKNEYIGLGETVGILPSGVAVALAFILLIFTLTFVGRGYALGWFGIIGCVMAFILLVAAAPIWYVTLAQAIVGIILIYICLIFKSETVAAT